MYSEDIDLELEGHRDQAFAIIRSQHKSVQARPTVHTALRIFASLSASMQLSSTK
jgi:hypothetical protein